MHVFQTHTPPKGDGNGLHFRVSSIGRRQDSEGQEQIAKLEQMIKQQEDVHKSFCSLGKTVYNLLRMKCPTALWQDVFPVLARISGTVLANGQPDARFEGESQGAWGNSAALGIRQGRRDQKYHRHGSEVRRGKCNQDKMLFPGVISDRRANMYNYSDRISPQAAFEALASVLHGRRKTALEKYGSALPDSFPL